MAIYQYLIGFNGLMVCKAHNISNPICDSYIKSRRVFLPFVTPNALGAYMALLAPLSMADKKFRWTGVLFVVVLLLSRSMGGFLALLAGVYICFIIFTKIQGRYHCCIVVYSGLCSVDFCVENNDG